MSTTTLPACESVHPVMDLRCEGKAADHDMACFARKDGMVHQWVNARNAEIDHVRPDWTRSYPDPRAVA